MVCPKCASTHTTEQEYDEAEAEEVSGVYIKALVILCHDCGWGWNCTGTQDRRTKKEKGKPPV